MASVLIVEDDGFVSRHYARVVRDAGHTPVIAPDARSAMREVAAAPDLILLDIGLPDCSGEEVLHTLGEQPETSAIPVVVITGKREAAARLRSVKGRQPLRVLLKPISESCLQQTIATALPARTWTPPNAPRPPEAEPTELARQLIVRAPESLALDVYRRLCADRAARRGLPSPPPDADLLSWTQIADWASFEGLLSGEEANLLRLLSEIELQ
jgi:CheY-like chemotaxis protein